MSTNSIRQIFMASVMAVASGIAYAAPAGPIGDLPGRWSGSGAVTYQNGETEQVKCVATYILDGAGESVRQSLRCASRSYDIDAIANLKVTDGQVSGAWEERRWSNTGSVAGRVTGDGLNLLIKGDSFSAAMAVSTTSCKQSINITPHGAEITKIAIGLGKC